MSESSTELPLEISQALRADENVVWAGRAPRDLLLPSQYPQIAFGFVAMVVGLVLAQRRWSLISPEVDFFLGFFAFIIGLLLAVASPAFDWASRCKTTYAVTSHRVVLCCPGRFFAQFFVNPQLEIEQARHRDGTTTIRFGTPSNATWLGGSQKSGVWVSPNECQLFRHVPQGDHLIQVIRSLCHYSRSLDLTGTDVPFIRRVDSEGQYDSMDPSPIHPLDYAQPLRAKLLRGEQTLFVDRPPQGIVFRESDWLLIPLSAVWTTIAVNWTLRAMRTGCPAIIGLVFVAVGVYMLIGRFYHDRARRARMWYSVTDRRCLIVEDGKIIETKSLYWNLLQGTRREIHRSGEATIYFELSALGRKDTTQDSGIESMGRPEGVYFERLDDPRNVESLVLEQVSRLWKHQQVRAKTL